MGIQVKEVIEINPLKARAQVDPPKQDPLPPVKASKPKEKPAEKRPRGRPQSGKETVTLRLSVEVINHFKPLGKNWKQAVDAYLRSSLKL